MSPTLFAQRPSQQPPRPAPTATPTPRAPSAVFLQRHPVLTYFVLVFTLSWGAMLLLTGGLGPIGTADPRFLFVALTAPIALAIVGLLLTGLVAGQAGYHDLLARLVRWRVSVRWYAVALLTAPLLTATAAILFALALRSTEFLPAILTTPDPLRLLLTGVLGGLVAGFWRGVGLDGVRHPSTAAAVRSVRHRAPRGRRVGRVALPVVPCRRQLLGGASLGPPSRAALRLAARLPGAHGMGLRPHREPARGGAHARDPGSEPADPPRGIFLSRSHWSAFSSGRDCCGWSSQWSPWLTAGNSRANSRTEVA